MIATRARGRHHRSALLHSLFDDSCARRSARAARLSITDQVCLQKLNELGSNGRSKATTWQLRMGRRIIEIDGRDKRKDVHV